MRRLLIWTSLCLAIVFAGPAYYRAARLFPKVIIVKLDKSAK